MIEGHFVDCFNPYAKPTHAFYSHIPPTQSDLAKLCGECWYIAGHQKPNTFIQGNPKAFKQCGSDTL